MIDNKLKGVINFANMSLTYDGKSSILQNVNFYVNKGEFVFLTGVSGSGKSTLLKSLYGAIKPVSGHLVVNGTDLMEANSNQIYDLRKELGIVFQDYKLISHLNIGENVSLPQEIKGKTDSEVRTTLEKMLGYMNILHLINKMPTEISGGEQQRAGLARALISNPDIILADEPTGNLDARSKQIVFDLLEAANRSGKTVVVATHDIPDFISVQTRVVTIENHRLVEHD
ncbi:MAG: ABC transporter ATP-binding protein [Campylobacterales bacterium]|nr:ABC transporter ATP-binding protein [Campylobacterales bacterium]